MPSLWQRKTPWKIPVVMATVLFVLLAAVVYYTVNRPGDSPTPVAQSDPEPEPVEPLPVEPEPTEPPSPAIEPTPKPPDNPANHSHAVDPPTLDLPKETPPDPTSDFPDAALEKPVMRILPRKQTLLFGLADDELGYIIPKRQWGQLSPCAYGRQSSQYGEINSCGPEVGPVIMKAFENHVGELAPR